MKLFAFYGTFTSTQPGHGNRAGARLVERTHTAPRYRLRTTDPERAAAACRRLDGLRDLQTESGELSFTLTRDEDTVALTKLLADAGIGITSLVREQATLEDLFFRLTEYEPDSPVTSEVAA